MTSIIKFSHRTGRTGRAQATRSAGGLDTRPTTVLVAGSLALDPGDREARWPELPTPADERAALGLLWEVESAQAAFYADLERRVELDEELPGRDVVRTIRLQERQHLAWLRRELAWYGERPEPGRFRFDYVGAAGLMLAGEFAEWAVAAYLAAVPALGQRELVVAALRILCVETRRAAYLSEACGTPPHLEIGDEAADSASLLAAVRRFRVG